MAEISKNVTKHRLIMGFISIILLFIAFGIISLLGIRGLSKVTRTIYNHPLVVSNASLHATISMIKMHRSMKDVALFDFPFAINAAITVVNEQEHLVYKNLDSVKRNILGDEGQKLENETRHLFVKWKPIREEVIKLVRKGQREEAAKITMAKGADHVTKLENKVLELTSYARKKATGFMENGEIVRSRIEETTIILMLIGILLSTIIAFFTIRQTQAMEGALRESEERFRDLYENAPNAYFSVGVDSFIRRCNQRAGELLGYAVEELVGRSVFELYADTPQGKEKALLLFERFRADEAIVDEELQMQKADGTSFWISLTVNAVGDSRGRLVESRSMVVDITDRKRAEEALQKAHDELEMRVSERTAQLVKTNQELQSEIEVRKKAEESLKKSEMELKRLSARLLEAHEEESKRIGQELHDGLAQTMSAIKVWGENALLQMRKGESKDSLIKTLESVVRLAQGSVEEVRRILGNLRPSILDDLGILSTISWLCHEFETIYSGIGIKKDIYIEENQIPDSLKIVIFRILQEAFNNIAKHSKANLARLSLKKTEDNIELSIHDDGKGFDVVHAFSVNQPSAGFGLASMRERSELSGGSFSIDSRKGEGTTIRVSWPYRNLQSPYSL
jgi:PAS domain S-box-containing protein